MMALSLYAFDRTGGVVRRRGLPDGHRDSQLRGVTNGLRAVSGGSATYGVLQGGPLSREPVGWLMYHAPGCALNLVVTVTTMDATEQQRIDDRIMSVVSPLGGVVGRV